MNYPDFYNHFRGYFLLISALLISLQCDDKSILGGGSTIEIDEKGLTVNLRRNLHQSGNFTLNLLVTGLRQIDTLSVQLTAKSPILVQDEDRDELIPQDTINLDDYATRTEASYEAQIYYNTESDSGKLFIYLNSQSVLNMTIPLSTVSAGKVLPTHEAHQFINKPAAILPEINLMR